MLVWRSYSTWLKCYSSCRLPVQSSYIWYKNGEKMSENQEEIYFSDNYHTDSYSCALIGHEDFPSPSVCEFTPQSSLTHSNNMWWRPEPTVFYCDCLWFSSSCWNKHFSLTKIISLMYIDSFTFVAFLHHWMGFKPKILNRHLKK